MENQGARHNPTRPHHGGSSGGREDCWSEGATGTLVEAWGDRCVRLNRGHLRQNDWKEVADAVNARQNGVKARKTDTQCKYRVDTLKKKYKLEKSKPAPSKWPFFYRLDSLIGINAASMTPSKKITGVNFRVKHSKLKLNPSPNPSPNFGVYSIPSSSKSRLKSVESTESSYGGGGSRDDDEEEDEYGNENRIFDRRMRRHPIDTVDYSDEAAACRELAMAIVKFGEIYERVESTKQQQMMELERQRMEFTKDLELQTMDMLVEAQLGLEKMARQKHASGTGKKL